MLLDGKWKLLHMLIIIKKNVYITYESLCK